MSSPTVCSWPGWRKRKWGKTVSERVRLARRQCDLSVRRSTRTLTSELNLPMYNPLAFQTQHCTPSHDSEFTHESCGSSIQPISDGRCRSCWSGMMESAAKHVKLRRVIPSVAFHAYT